MADVAQIVDDVRARGDVALREWSLELDGGEPGRAIPGGAAMPREELLVLADRVRRWHELQRPHAVALEVEPGVSLERRWIPLESVGIYVPRGLISTLVMCAVPAQVAGVERIVVVTPPACAGVVAAAGELLGDAVALADRVRNAGAVFVGDHSPVAAGDYATGGNHVLPTGGRARSTGGLGLEAFLKPVTVQRLTRDGLELVRPVVEALAHAEGMTAHAEAVQPRD